MVTMTEDLANDAVTKDKIVDGAMELSVEQVGGPPTIIGPGGSGEATVSCDKGEVVVEGVFESDSGFQPNTSQPYENIWIVDGRNTWNTEIALIAVALCA